MSASPKGRAGDSSARVGEVYHVPGSVPGDVEQGHGGYVPPHGYMPMSARVFVMAAGGHQGVADTDPDHGDSYFVLLDHVDHPKTRDKSRAKSPVAAPGSALANAQTSLTGIGQGVVGYGSTAADAPDAPDDLAQAWGAVAPNSGKPKNLAAGPVSTSRSGSSPCPALCKEKNLSLSAFVVPAFAGSLTVGLLYNYSKLGMLADAFASGTFGFGAIVLGSAAFAMTFQLLAAWNSRSYRKTPGASFLNVTHCESWATPNFLLNRIAFALFITGQVIAWGFSSVTSKTPDETHFFSEHPQGVAAGYLGTMILMASALLAQVLNVRAAPDEPRGAQVPFSTGAASGRRSSLDGKSVDSGKTTGTAAAEAEERKRVDPGATSVAPVMSMQPAGRTKAEKEAKKAGTDALKAAQKSPGHALGRGQLVQSREFDAVPVGSFSGGVVPSASDAPAPRRNQTATAFSAAAVVVHNPAASAQPKFKRRTDKPKGMTEGPK